MAQLDFPAIGNHLEDIQNGIHGIQNQVVLVANIPAVVGYNELRWGLWRERKTWLQRTNELWQERNELRQKTNQLRQKTDGNHIEIMAILPEIRGQIGQIQNEYLYWSPFGNWV